MNILEQETKKKVSKSKKVVLTFLIISIIALIISLCAMMILKEKEGSNLKVYINQNELPITESTLINNNGTTYISLNQIAKFIDYDYRRGGYLEQELDDNKCYLEGNDQIIGFEASSKKIYKTSLESEKDYQ